MRGIELVDFFNIIGGGLVLCIGIECALPCIGKFLEEAGKVLGGFQTLIGIIALIIGVLGVLDVM